LSETERQQLRQLAQDVPALWHAPTTAPQDRKRLLRCLIRDISLDSFSQPGFSRIAIRWHTGTITSLSVPRPKPGRHTSADLIERIRSLAQSQPDDQIALTLNQEGRLTFIPLRGIGWHPPGRPANPGPCSGSPACAAISSLFFNTKP
jgi:hypothetical protein